MQVCVQSVVCEECVSLVVELHVPVCSLGTV